MHIGTCVCVCVRVCVMARAHHACTRVMMRVSAWDVGACVCGWEWEWERGCQVVGRLSRFPPSWFLVFGIDILMKGDKIKGASGHTHLLPKRMIRLEYIILLECGTADDEGMIYDY